MEKIEETLKRTRFCINLLKETLDKKLEPLSKEDISVILGDIIDIIDGKTD